MTTFRRHPAETRDYSARAAQQQAWDRNRPRARYVRRLPLFWTICWTAWCVLWAIFWLTAGWFLLGLNVILAVGSLGLIAAAFQHPGTDR